MKISRLDQVPMSWSGIPLGVDKTNAEDKGTPRVFRSFVLEALTSAHLSGYTQMGQHASEDPKKLLQRSRLISKLSNGAEVEVYGEEFSIVEQCISGHFIEVAAVQLIGFLHDSVVAEVNDVS
jgi:hypothetical protein